MNLPSTRQLQLFCCTGGTPALRQGRRRLLRLPVGIQHCDPRAGDPAGRTAGGPHEPAGHDHGPRPGGGDPGPALPAGHRGPGGARPDGAVAPGRPAAPRRHSDDRAVPAAPGPAAPAQGAAEAAAVPPRGHHGRDPREAPARASSTCCLLALPYDLDNTEVQLAVPGCLPAGLPEGTRSW